MDRKNKAINKITLAVITVALVFVLMSYYIGATSEKNETPQALAYETSLFNGDVFEVNIIADDNVWQDMLDHATDEEYVCVDVMVNGELFKNVGIRPKGNSSLLTVSRDPTSDRYSFKIKFDEYMDGQTCFGLDTLVLNNIISDNTYMKEYIAYDLMNFIGVEAVHYGYSTVLLNGEAWGLYLALETYNDSYLTSTYGTTNGYLYAAKSSDLFSDEAMPTKDNMETSETRGMSNTGGGLDFVYIGDDVDDYENLFANNVGDEATDDDEARVVEALKALNENKNIEDYWDVDAILRYLAAHTVTVNSDSISTNMCQNYYLYELDGVVTILPWDYNETFGASVAAINFPIDTPISGVEMEERPIINVLFQNEEYLETYHQYLQEIVDGYFNESAISDKITELDTLINEYVKNDATAFYGYDAYTEAIIEFEKVLVARSDSIAGQLDGNIPSTTDSQTASTESLIGIDEIDTSKLTSGNTSIGGTGGKGGMGGRSDQRMPPGNAMGMPNNIGNVSDERSLWEVLVELLNKH